MTYKLNFILVFSCIVGVNLSSCTLQPPNLNDSFNDCASSNLEETHNIDDDVICSCIWDCTILRPNRYEYQFPSFNPQSPNQISYLRRDNENFTGNNYELWTFDFCTEESVLLYDQVSRTTSWSLKDWILFTGTDRQIWKIKSNGDSLIRVTDSGDYNNEPAWGPLGNRFIYTKIDGPNAWHIISDFHGIPIDTIHERISSPLWVAENTIIVVVQDSPENHGVGFYDIKSKTLTQLTEFDITSSIDSLVTDVEWDKKNMAIVWVSEQAVNSINISTLKKSSLLVGAPNRRYVCTTISPQGGRSIVNRVDSKQISDCEIEVSYGLYMMNIDGTDERKILIPE